VTDSPLLTLAEAAAYLRLGESTLARLAARGEMATIRLGGLRRFHRADLDSFIVARRRPAREKVHPARAAGYAGDTASEIAAMRAYLAQGSGRPSTSGKKRTGAA
jgi:excisionase family DNA binding protein